MQVVLCTRMTCAQVPVYMPVYTGTCAPVYTDMCTRCTQVLCTRCTRPCAHGVHTDLCTRCTRPCAHGVHRDLCTRVHRALCTHVHKALCTHVHKALCTRVHKVLCTRCTQACVQMQECCMLMQHSQLDESYDSSSWKYCHGSHTTLVNQTIPATTSVAA